MLALLRTGSNHAAQTARVSAPCPLGPTGSQPLVDDDEVMLNVLGCRLTYQGQAETNAEAWFNKSLRQRKPEGHLDSHTAPELCALRCLSTALMSNSTESCTPCSPKAVFSILRDSVGHFRLSNPQGSPCRNLHPLPDLKQCGGQCGSQSRPGDLIGGFQSTCSCCQPTSVSQRHVTLTCEDGTSLEHSYTVAEACQCGACSEGQ